jgi:hypothetical protein
MSAARAASTISCSAVEIGAQVVGAGDQRGRFAGDYRGREHAGGGHDHRQHRFADGLAEVAYKMRGYGTRQDDQVGLRSRDRIDVERMPFAPDAVHPDRDRHRPVARHSLDRRMARGRLVRQLHRVLEVEDYEVGAGLPCLGDRPRVGCGEKQQLPYAEKVDGHADFALPRVPAVAS